MALIKCPECGKEISSNAKSCPNCGVKVKKSNWKAVVYNIIFWSLTFLYGCNTIVALSNIKNDVFFFIAELLITICLCPAIRNYINKKFNKNIKWYKQLIAVLIIALVYGGIFASKQNQNTTLSDTANISSKTQDYSIVNDYDGLYSFEVVSDNVRKNVAKGILELKNGNCTVKYFIVYEDKSNLEECIQTGNFGKQNGKDNIYISVERKNYNHKNIYECNPNNSNLECTLIEGYDFTGNTNKSLILTHLESSNIDEEYAKIKQPEQEAVNQAKAQMEAEEQAKKAQEETSFKTSCKSYTYEQMARNPDNFKGTNVKLTGQVIQALYASNSVDLRINITKTGTYSTFYEDTIYAVYYPKTGEDKILEDDIITIYGTSQGDYTYTSAIGSSITLPLINVKYIERNK